MFLDSIPKTIIFQYFSPNNSKYIPRGQLFSIFRKLPTGNQSPRSIQYFPSLSIYICPRPCYCISNKNNTTAIILPSQLPAAIKEVPHGPVTNPAANHH